MKKLGIAIIVLVTIFIIGSMVATLFISSDGVLKTVTENVKSSTGRILTIEGEHQVSVFPSLVVELNDVKFANAEHGTEPHMASMSMLSLHIPWTSVFTGTFVIDKFVIDELQLTLEKSVDGEVNWQMGPVKGSSRSERPAANQSDAVTEAGKFPEAFDISLGQVEIRSGSFTYIDHQKDSVERISDLSLAIILPSLRKPLQIDGSLEYNHQIFTVQTKLDNPIKLLNGETFATNLSLQSQLVNLQYQGDVQQTPFEISGELSVSGDSVKEILVWHGQPLNVKENAFNQFSLQASIALTENLFTLKEMNFQLDALDIKGSSTVAFSATPKIDALVNLGDLDLNPYLPEVTEAQPTTEEKKVPLQWDDTELDLSGISAANLALQISSNSLQFRDIKLGQNKLNLSLNNGLMEVALEEFNAYAGSGSGRLSLNATARPYQITSNFALQGIDFQPLLTDVAKFDKLLGGGQVEWQLQTRGSSQQDFVSALNGNLGFEVKDGAIRGANIAAIAKSAENILKGDIASVNLDQNFNDAEKTDFASLTGNLNFSNGVMNTNDILLLNPFVRVAVTGNVDLPATNTNLRANTRVVSSVEGQGGEVDLSGVSIPVKITGPFHDVKIRPDMESLLKKQFEDKLKDKLSDKLKGLFGG